MIPLGVIVASTREGRLGGRVAEWFTGLASAHGGFDIDVVDLAVITLPGRLPAGNPSRESGAVAR